MATGNIYAYVCTTNIGKQPDNMFVNEAENVNPLFQDIFVAIILTS